jgi:hypothetical protein
MHHTFSAYHNLINPACVPWCRCLDEKAAQKNTYEGHDLTTFAKKVTILDAMYVVPKA